MKDKITLRVRAMTVWATHHGQEVRQAFRAGLRHLGVSGGDHVLRDGQGRLWRVDLVIDRVALCVGYPPKIYRF